MDAAPALASSTTLAAPVPVPASARVQQGACTLLTLCVRLLRVPSRVDVEVRHAAVTGARATATGALVHTEVAHTSKDEITRLLERAVGGPIPPFVRPVGAGGFGAKRKHSIIRDSDEEDEEEVEEGEEEEEEEADGGEDGGMDRVLRSEGTRRPVERLAAVDWRKREEAEVEAPPAAEEGAVKKRPIGLSTLVDDPNYEASESEEEVPVEAEEEKEEEEEERPRPPLPLENERLDLGTIQVRAHVPPPAELSCSPRRDL